MEKKKKNLIEEIEQTLDKKLTVAEMYANRPRKWVLYLAIVLLIVVMVGWSASDIKFTGLTVTGTEVAKGVLHGVFSPDTALLFGTALSSDADHRHCGARHAYRRGARNSVCVPRFVQHYA